MNRYRYDVKLIDRQQRNVHDEDFNGSSG